MSLESQIADLVTATNGLITAFNAKKAGIDSSVAAAIAAVPDALRTWYVDQVNGLDTNAGTLAAPFKTINKALAATPSFGVCTVQLLSDYNFTETINTTAAYLLIVGNGAVRSLNPKYIAVVSTVDGSTSTILGGIQMAQQACNVEFRNCNVSFPSSAGVVPAPTVNRTTGFVRTNGTGSVPPLIGVALASVTVLKPADFIGTLIGQTVAAVALSCISTTFPGDMGGKFIGGIASGTLPKDTTNILSNLGAL
jgi:hypothetical protein